MTAAIRIQGLSKRYLLRHGPRERYVALRDVLSRSARGAKERLASLLSPRPESKSTVEEFWALKDVSFDVERGDRIGVIGRNGAGKSTLLKVLSRITEPTRGRIEIAGRVASLLEVGTGFHPELSGRENIFLNGAILGMTRTEIRRRFDDIVAFAEVEQFLDTPVKRYSSGMYVRLAFAVAAHLETEILIVDEVLAVGDAQFQRKCLGKMKEAGADGRTVLFVSHNMAALSALCDKAVWLSQGSVRALGPADAVTSRYLSDGAQESADVPLADKPQDSRFRFTRLRLLDAAGKPVSNFDVREPIVVELAYEAREKMRSLELSARVYNLGGVPIFTTNRSASVSPDVEQGEFVSRLALPSHFLSPGAYTITIGAHIPNVQVLGVLESVATFRVEETGSLMAAYAGQDHGVVLTHVRWEESRV